MKSIYSKPEIKASDIVVMSICGLSVVDFQPGATFEEVEFDSIESKDKNSGGWNDEWLQ